MKRGQIYYIESNHQEIGSEQRAGRPAVIVSNNKNNENSTTVEVVYMTTAVFEKGKHPYHLIAEKGGGSTVYGWVDTKDIGETSQASPAASASFSVGDKVKVRGSVHCYGNGSGGDANRDGSTMYVVGLVSSKTYKYYIGVADKKGGARIGWAEPSQLSHC